MRWVDMAVVAARSESRSANAMERELYKQLSVS